MSFASLEIAAGEAHLPVILRDVRQLARRGSFPVASRRFGELRLEDGRLQQFERTAEASLGPEYTAEVKALAASRARLLRLESACATALERCRCADYEETADALEHELLAHAALERRLNRKLQHGR